MKPILPSSGVSRRTLLSTLAALALLHSLLLFNTVQAQTDPLPSWADGPAKQAIIALVKATTDRMSPKFVLPEMRIATFDQDGTTWVSHPMYTQVMYCLERVPAVVAKKPELKNVEPFKTVLTGNRKAIAKLSMKDLEKILVATLTGMTVDEFKAEVTKWIATAKHPRWDRLYTELTYQPMLEVMHCLRENGYKTSRPSRSWAPWAGHNTAMARTANRSSQGGQAHAERQRCRQARRHSYDDRSPADYRIW
jgi:hypothetical protein